VEEWQWEASSQMVLPWRMLTGAEPGAVKATSPVLNGGEEETCRVQRALSLSTCLAPALCRARSVAFGIRSALSRNNDVHQRADSADQSPATV